jgi:TatD DNase family protein
MHNIIVVHTDRKKLTMLVDSHCHLDHLDLAPYDGDLSKAIAAAREKDVGYILSPGVNLEEFPNILKIVETDEKFFASVGVHPTEKEARKPTLKDLLEFGQNKKVVGIGETGLDYAYCNNEEECQKQKDLFKIHIEAAKSLSKPLIIHSRDAEDDMIKILLEEDAVSVGGVMHCFTGTPEMAQKVLDLGFYISISGIVTFKNAHTLREIVKNIPLERMLIETDAPYLTPVPVRGKSNEPAYLCYIADFIANLREVPHKLLADQTTENFLKIIGGKHPTQ